MCDKLNIIIVLTLEINPNKIIENQNKSQKK